MSKPFTVPEKKPKNTAAETQAPEQEEVAPAAAEPSVPLSQVAEAIKQGIAEGMAMAAMATQQAKPEPFKLQEPLHLGGRCGECGQFARACKGKHRQVAVYPLNPRHGRWFQGVFINGVRYLSNSLQHYVVVPADSDVEYEVAKYERNEDEALQGRETFHNSGLIGNGVQQFNAAHTAFGR